MDGGRGAGGLSPGELLADTVVDPPDDDSGLLGGGLGGSVGGLLLIVASSGVRFFCPFIGDRDFLGTLMEEVTNPSGSLFLSMLGRGEVTCFGRSTGTPDATEQATAQLLSVVVIVVA